MALSEYIRTNDLKRLVQDYYLEVGGVFYLPVFESFEVLDIMDGDPDKPGAAAAYMDGGKVLLASYNGDGTWSKGIGGDPSIILDSSLPTSGTLAYLNTNHGTVSIGTIVYREFGNEILWCEKYAENKWTREQKLQAT